MKRLNRPETVIELAGKIREQQSSVSNLRLPMWQWLKSQKYLQSENCATDYEEV